MFTRRSLLAAAPALLAAGCAKAEVPRQITIYKTASCGCCNGWVTHMQRAGFVPTVVTLEELATLFEKRGVPFELSSCHMGDIEGYLIAGHVPPADVERLLKERPDGLGLSVPGMPWGSPGMENPSGETEPYKTLLVLPGGKTRVFAQHG